MKSKLLWVIILLEGAAAVYFGLARPAVSTESKRSREYYEKDPATQRPIKLPPVVVSESRLPGTDPEPAEPARAPANTK